MGSFTKDKILQKEKLVYDRICEFRRIKGFTPTIREIQLICGFRSSSTAHGYFKRLENKDLIVRNNKMPRAINTKVQSDA